MLSELHRAVARIGFEVDFVVAVVVEGGSQVADTGGAVDTRFADGRESLTIAVVASASRHEAVNDSFEAFVGEYKVFPS